MELWTPHDLPVILFRLFLAFCVGAVMGIERERQFRVKRGVKGAGFRTFTLTCFGSCLFGLVSLYGFPSSGTTSDPGRIAAQVVAGVGFLGAGAILKHGSEVRGLTTAAGMWTASAIGLMISAGMYLPALVASMLAYVILDFHNLFPRMFTFKRQAPEEELYMDQTGLGYRKIRSSGGKSHFSVDRRKKGGKNRGGKP